MLILSLVFFAFYIAYAIKKAQNEVGARHFVKNNFADATICRAHVAEN